MSEDKNKGHTWRMYDYDPTEIDMFGLNEDYHNGPICTTCGYSYCHHCNRDGPPSACTNPAREDTNDNKSSNPTEAQN